MDLQQKDLSSHSLKWEIPSEDIFEKCDWLKALAQDCEMFYKQLKHVGFSNSKALEFTKVYLVTVIKQWNDRDIDEQSISPM